tara:strand:- start:340 stop:852 length:513 start_codon:yes stop_codon:yes gene_type:complete
VKKKELIHIGTFSKARGIKGEINIIMYASDFVSFKSFSPFFLDNKGSNVCDFKSLKYNKGKILAKISECNSRNEAEKLSGKKIFIYKSKLPKTIKNQFYIFDLVNCEVKTIENKLLGIVVEVNNFGASDLLNIKKLNNKKFYIPLNKENVVKVDIKKKLIIVNPIKGIIN